MAKKAKQSTKKTVSAKGKAKSPRTKKFGAAGPKIEELAKSIVTMSQKKKDPAIAIPTRSLSNVNYNEKTRYVEMGDNKQSRNFFNYGQAKRFMQTATIDMELR